jgi:hypothetical protein
VDDNEVRNLAFLQRKRGDSVTACRGMFPKVREYHRQRSFALERVNAKYSSLPAAQDFKG